MMVPAKTSRVPSPDGPLVAGLAFVAAYLAFEYLSLVGLYRWIGITPWSPAAGLTLAFVYWKGERAWWPVLLALLAAKLFIYKLPIGMLNNLLLSVGTMLVALVAGRVLRIAPGSDPTFRSVRAVLVLVVLAGAYSLTQTTLYVGTLWSLSLVPSHLLWATSWRHFVGEVVGVLAVTPLLLIVNANRSWPRLERVHAIQLLVMLAALFMVFGLVDANSYYHLFYLLFLPILWVALREGIGGTVIALNICQLGIIIGAQLRIEPTPGVGALQVLMVVLLITGLLVGVVVTERQDASQRVRDQQAALNRALRLRSAGETAAAIAHQINQPLTAITTYAALANDALSTGDVAGASASMNKVSSECDRAATVLRSVRDLVKLGGLTRAPTTMRSIMSELDELLGAECEASRIELEIVDQTNGAQFNIDRTQLQQALYNLVNNSIEALRDSGRPGHVRVSTEVVSGDIVIDVTDDGPGFAPGLDALATTPFMTTKDNGSGLGLAIARSVAESHGGSLSILPRTPGATVRMALPASRGPHGQGNQYH